MTQTVKQVQTYVLHDPLRQWVKIGRSVNVEKRARSIRAASGAAVELLGFHRHASEEEPMTRVKEPRPTTTTQPLREALKTSLAVLLHEEADPACTGEPPYTYTEEKAASLVDRAFEAPVVTNALEDDPAIGVQDFASGNLTVMEQGEYRYVRFEECPTDPDGRCQSEYHHWVRGDHVVPLDPDWSPR